MAGRYYWLKLKKDFFDNKKIKILEREKRGKEILLFYLKLLVLGIESEGRLRYDEERSYSVAHLAVITDSTPTLVKLALEQLKSQGFIKLEEDGTLVLPGLSEMVGSEGESASRMRRCREKASQCDANVTESKRLEKEIEKEIDSDPELEESGGAAVVVQSGDDMIDSLLKYGVRLTISEQNALVDRMGMARLMDYLIKMEQFAILKKRKIKDPYQTILKWYQEDET